MDTNNDLIGIYTKQISTTQEVSSMDSSSAKDYILDNDEELYNFITQFGDFNTDEERRAEIESI